MTLLIRSIPKEGKEAYSFEPNKDQLIESGDFTDVFRAVRKHDQQLFTIKRYKDALDKSVEQAAYEAVRLMKEIPHPFIVKVIDSFLDDSGHLCIVQEIYN